MDKIINKPIYEMHEEEGYLRISGKFYSKLSGTYKGEDIVYIHREDVLWVLNTIRTFKKELYNRGSDRNVLEHSEENYVSVNMGGSDADRSLFGDIRISCTNDKSEHDSIHIPYYGPDPMAPEGDGEGFLYNFLMQLETFVPEDQKKDIVPQW